MKPEQRDALERAIQQADGFGVFDPRERLNRLIQAVRQVLDQDEPTEPPATRDWHCPRCHATSTYLAGAFKRECHVCDRPRPPDRCLCDPQIHAQVGCPAPDCSFKTEPARLAVEVARSLSAIIHLSDCHAVPSGVMSRAYEDIRLAFRGGRVERPTAAEEIRLAAIEEAGAVLDGYAADWFETETRGQVSGGLRPSELYREAAGHVRALRHKRERGG